MPSPASLPYIPGWFPVSREEALRLCERTAVVVVRPGAGLAGAIPFGPGCYYYLASGPYDYSTLRYFAAAPDGTGAAPANGRLGRSGVRHKERFADASDPGEATDVYAAPVSEEDAWAADDEERAPRETPAIRIVKLDCDFFAPVEESVLVHFAIEGDLSLAEAIHLRIASEKQPGRFLLNRRVDAKPRASGSFPWDGLVTDGAYPGCLTLAGSPYLVQLGLAPKGGSPVFTNKAALRVELARTELAVGDPSGLGEDAGLGNQEMVARLKEELAKSPDRGTVHLPGSFFKNGVEEMATSASFTVYGDRLKSGLGVPLFVRLWVKSKDGSPKRSPKAVTGTRILWDTVPDDKTGLESNLSERGVHPEAKSFMQGVGAYKQDKTEPKGHSAHWELGGIRAAAAARKFGRRQWDVLGSVWAGDALKQRTWAGRSVCAQAGDAAADSGVLYYNGRIAGDRYTVSAYADLDGSLDDKQPDLAGLVPAERKSRAMSLRNWRDVRIVANYTIGASTAPISFDGPNREFKKAAISILPDPGLQPLDIQDRWRTAYQEVIKASAETFVRDAAMEEPGLHPVRYLDPEDYWQKTNADAGAFGRIWHRIKAFFGATDEDGYREKCDTFAYEIYSEAVTRIPLGKGGITCIKFGAKGDHNQWRGSYTAGMAPSIFGYTGRSRALLLLFNNESAEHTVIHELGHILFLPHAPGHWIEGAEPEGCRPELHDRAQKCLMSYHPDAECFCGLCLLRLAGWDHGSIKPDGTVTDLMGLE